MNIDNTELMKESRAPDPRDFRGLKIGTFRETEQVVYGRINDVGEVVYKRHDTIGQPTPACDQHGGEYPVIVELHNSIATS